MGGSMTDLNKERSEFEAIKEIQDSIRREQLIFNTKLGCYTKKSGKMCVSANWTNGAWFMFERKAKAQAVPNEIINEIQSWVAVKSFAVEDAHPDLPIIDANELAEFIDQLVASESGAEG